jgi:hypothetical protein
MRVRQFIYAAAIAIPATAPIIVANDSLTVLAGCEHGFYENSSGQCVPDPSAGGPDGPAGPGLMGPFGTGAPAGATARCRDGDYSYSTHHTGTCSGHGGVSQWLAN